MRNAILIFILACCLFSCSTRPKESYFTFKYKATKMVPLVNKSSNQSQAETYLELRRGPKGISQLDRKELVCYWQKQLDKIRPELTPTELAALAEYEKKLAEDPDFPYHEYTDSGSVQVSTKTIWNIFKSIPQDPCK